MAIYNSAQPPKKRCQHKAKANYTGYI